jgi:hypothetical protein
VVALSRHSISRQKRLSLWLLNSPRMMQISVSKRCPRIQVEMQRKRRRISLEMLREARLHQERRILRRRIRMKLKRQQKIHRKEVEEVLREFPDIITTYLLKLKL